MNAIFQERLRATYACSTDQVKTVSVDGREVTFFIEEISDLSDLGTVEDVDIWLLCFNIMSAASLHSLYLQWVPRLSSSPFLLVGCQADLRRDKLTRASLSRSGGQPVSSNMALSFCRQMEAVMYVETESRISHRSATAAFELAAKTSGGQFSRQSSIMSSSSSVTIPLLSQRSRSTTRVTSSEFWSRLRSPSTNRRAPGREKENRIFPSKRSKSSARVGTLEVTPSSSRRFGLELNRSQAEKTVKIKCLRMTEEKAQEEIEIEVPESIYVNLEDDGESDSCVGWSRRIKGYFNK